MPNNIVWSLPTLVENLLKHRITSNSQRLMPIETNYDKDVFKYWLGFVDSASSLVLTSWQVVHHGYPHIYNLHQPETKYEYCLCIRWDSRCPGFLFGTPWSQCLHADFHSFPTLFFIFPTMMIVNVLMNSWWTKFLSKQAIVIVLQPLGQLKCTLKCLFNPKYPSSYVNRYFQSCPRPIINTSDQIGLHSIKEWKSMKCYLAFYLCPAM